MRGYVHIRVESLNSNMIWAIVPIKEKSANSQLILAHLSGVNVLNNVYLINDASDEPNYWAILQDI